MGALPPVAAVLAKDIQWFVSRMTAAQAEMAKTEAQTKTLARIAAIAAESAKTASEFQKATNLAESAGAIDMIMIRRGVLSELLRFRETAMQGRLIKEATHGELT